MSNEKQVVTAAVLQAIPYHDLKDKLEELGLGACWKGGVKKVDIIKDAMSKLNIVKEMKEKEMSQEDIDKQLSLSDAIKEEKEKEAIIEEKIEEEKIMEEETQDLKEQVTAFEEVDVEKLMLQLRRIKGNLKSGIESHRKQLLKRKAQVTAILKEAGVEVEE